MLALEPARSVRSVMTKNEKKISIDILSHLDRLFRACPETGMPGVVYDIVSKQRELGPDEARQKLGEQERQWADKCLLPVF